ncbi:EcsC family protein [Sediminimonas qiaohouensis]|uniref:EcsC family protein n=1 Tax=Sediminimonas qiaohouensis TaxID=552061 RepID=UPI00040E0D03|nr:EcsC family protein [Sediminimonas qiaohouensis]
MTEILPPAPSAAPDLEAELAALARRYRGADGAAMRLLTQLGTQAETLLERLPDDLRGGLNGLTSRALEQAMGAAHSSRGWVGDQPAWAKTALATALGGFGGAGGLPGAMVELPVTTTLLLRAIQDVAAGNGFDPGAESVRFDCLEVFGAAGPLTARDDGADLAFLSTRLALRGATVQTLIARVAPRLATVLGQKLAAQTVPVLGAVAGATVNYAFTSYYQEMAQVHFGLRRLAIAVDKPHAELVEDLRARIAAQSPARK